MKRRTLLTIFAALLPVLSGLRIYEMVCCIDPSNGFFKSEYTSLMYLTFTVIFLLVVAAFLLGGRFSGDYGKVHTPPKKNLALSFCSALCGVGILADIAVKIKTDVVDFKAKYNVDTVKDESVIYILCALSVVAALIFFVQSKNFATGKGLSAGLTVSTAAWALVRLFVRYTLEFNGLALISENILDIFALCALMMSLLYIAHIYAGMTPKKSEAKLFGFGICAILFSVITFVSRIVLVAANNQNALTHSANPSFAGLFISAYIFVLLINLTSEKTVTQNTDDNETEEEHYHPMIEQNDPVCDDNLSDNFGKTEAENDQTPEQKNDGANSDGSSLFFEGELSADGTHNEAQSDIAGETFKNTANSNLSDNISEKEKENDRNKSGGDQQNKTDENTQNQVYDRASGQSNQNGLNFDDFSVDSILAQIEKQESERT